MKTPIKYNIPDETPDIGMVSDSLSVANARGDIYQTYPLHIGEMGAESESMEIEALQYSLIELDSHLEESELQFLTGNFLTMEEADRDMESFIRAL